MFKTGFSIAMIVLIVIVAIAGIAFVSTGLDLASYTFWAPKQINAQNQVFHQSQPFVDGKIDELSQLCREATTTTGDQKLAFQNEILNDSRTIDNSKLPSDIQSCISTAKGN